MSTAAALPQHPPRPRAGARRSTKPAWSTIWPVLAFCALALLAGVRFASLLSHPPVLRVLGVVAAVGAGGLALSHARSLSPRRELALASNVLIVALSAYLALRASGVPGALLWPWRWGHLRHELGHGLNALNGRWPYRGAVAQARMTVMFALPAAIVPAALLAFWPTDRRAGTRHALALVPLLVLYTAAATNESQVGWQVQGMLLLALLCAWRWAWQPQTRDLARAAAWLLVGATLALLGAAAVQSRAPLLDYRGWNPFGPSYSPTSFGWNQAYGPLPWSSSTETMVSVASRTPHLWRATTLDRFDGVGFVRSNRQPGPHPSARAPENAAGVQDAVFRPQWVTQATFTVRGLNSRDLLSPGQIMSVSIVGEATPSLRKIAADGTLGVSAAPRGGDRYTVTAYAPQPSVAEMRRAPRAVPAFYAPYTQLELPSHSSPVTISPSTTAGAELIDASRYAPVYELARSLAVGATSNYEVVARMDAFFAQGFTYDLQPRRSAYPLIAFLFDERSGYCQQFSGAMTLMLRMDGIPARVAAGFLPGSASRSTGLYDVTAQDAHEWVEVFFAGIGWVPFNPTPAGKEAAGTSLTLAKAERSASTLRHRALPRQALPGGQSKVRAVRSGAGPGGSPALAIGLAGGALALLLGVAWIASAIRLERTLAGDADGAVREISRALSTAGLSLAPSTTLAQLERELQRSHGPAAAGYLRLLRERRYAADADPQALYGSERRLLRRALCRGRGPLTRLRVLVALQPGGGRAAQMLRSNRSRSSGPRHR
jgi:transglutaminase-like putative cysteine protease